MDPSQFSSHINQLALISALNALRSVEYRMSEVDCLMFALCVLFRSFALFQILSSCCHDGGRVTRKLFEY